MKIAYTEQNEMKYNAKNWPLAKKMHTGMKRL